MTAHCLPEALTGLQEVLKVLKKKHSAGALLFPSAVEFSSQTGPFSPASEMSLLTLSLVQNNSQRPRGAYRVPGLGSHALPTFPRFYPPNNPKTTTDRQTTRFF